MIPLLAVALLTLGVVAMDGWLLQLEPAREILAPDPPRVAQNFIGALAACRPAIAQHYVADAARAQLSREHLRRMGSRLRSRHGDFRFAGASELERREEASTVRTTLRTGDHGTAELLLHLTRDPTTHLWKIAAM